MTTINKIIADIERSVGRELKPHERCDIMHGIAQTAFHLGRLTEDECFQEVEKIQGEFIEWREACEKVLGGTETLNRS